MKTKGCEYGHYNGLSYRICYGVTDDGNMDRSIPHYEFVKDCQCASCNSRFRYNRLGLRNELTVSTDDMSLFPKVEQIINDYTCGEKGYIGRKYILMYNGKVIKKIIKSSNGKSKETIIS